MTFKEVNTMLAGINVPTAYHHFAENTGQQPPFICFYFDGSRDQYADDSNYQKIEHLIIELYTDNKDFTLEATVESALASSGLTWTRNETYIETELMYEVIYETDVVITEEPITEENNNNV